jgi:hypothetical protein
MPTRTTLYTPMEMARRLQVEEEAILELVRRGEIECISIPPDIIRFTAEQLRRFLAAHKQPFPGTAWLIHTPERQAKQVERETRRDERRRRDEEQKARLPPDDRPGFLNDRVRPDP